jgi:hypothetical protein
LSLGNVHSYPDERRGRAEYQMAAQGTSMAIQTLQLAASAAGLVRDDQRRLANTVLEFATALAIQ